MYLLLGKEILLSLIRCYLLSLVQKSFMKTKTKGSYISLDLRIRLARWHSCNDPTFYSRDFSSFYKFMIKKNVCISWLLPKIQTLNYLPYEWMKVYVFICVYLFIHCLVCNIQLSRMLNYT